MSLESRNAGARAALEMLSLHTKTAARAVRWSRLADDQFAPEIDARLKRLHEYADQLEHRGSMLSADQLRNRHIRLSRLARSLEEAHQEQVARNQIAYNTQFTNRGQAPQAPRQASLLNRLTGNRTIFGRTWGTSANMPAAAHRADDIAAALSRADGVVPQEVHQLFANRKGATGLATAAAQRAATTGSGAAVAGGLGRLALGAGALFGGGYLLKKLMSDDEPAQAAVNPYAQQPTGY